MEKARKHMFIFRMVCVILAIVTALPLCIAGCNKNKHVCESKCPTCGYCLNKECKDPVCEMKCKGHKDDGPVTIKGVQIAIEPKTEYLPGEVFDPSGLVVKATLSNGKSKTFFDKDLTEYTHKGEALTKEVNKITFTIAAYDNYAFDLGITVGTPKDLKITVDTLTLKEFYTTDETIDLSTIGVKITTKGLTTVLKDDEYKLYIGETEVKNRKLVSAKTLGAGETAVTVKYQDDTTKDFKIKIVDKTGLITPAIIEAEDCAYRLSGVDKNSESSLLGTETNEQYLNCDRESEANMVKDGEVVGDGWKITNGTSGRGASSGLSQNAKTIYYKFKVSVPAAGSYKLRTRIASTWRFYLKNKFAININGKKDSDGKFDFTLNETNQIIERGNQVDLYCDLGGAKLSIYHNLFWWGMIDLGNYDLKAGENEIRVYIPTGIEANIDYFEVIETTETDVPKIVSLRTGVRKDLDNEIIYLKKGEKLSDIVSVSDQHPVRYTRLYMRTSKGREIPVLESMVEGKIDYNKIGVEQVITVTDPVDGDSASFTIFIEEMKSE